MNLNSTTQLLLKRILFKLKNIFILFLSSLGFFIYLLLNLIYILITSLFLYCFLLVRVQFSFLWKAVFSSHHIYLYKYCVLFFVLMKQLVNFLFYGFFFFFENTFLFNSFQLFLWKNYKRIQICLHILDFFFYKTKQWLYSAFYLGILKHFWTFSISFSFFVYIYFFYIFFAIFLFFLFLILNFYIYCIFLFLCVLIVYYVFVFLYKITFFCLQHICPFLLETIPLFINYVSLLHLFLNSYLLQTTKHILLFEEDRNSKENDNVSKLSLLLFLLNLNNARFLNFLKKNKGQEKKLNTLLFQTKSVSELSQDTGLLNFFLQDISNNKGKTGFAKKTEVLFLLDILKWFSSTEGFNMSMMLRKLMNQTTDKGDVLDLEKKAMLKGNVKASNKAFDLLTNTTWLKTAEPVLIENLVSETDRTEYRSRYKRPVKLIYSFFKEAQIPQIFWNTLYSFIKYQRHLKMNRLFFSKNITPTNTQVNVFVNTKKEEKHDNFKITRKIRGSDNDMIINWPHENQKESLNFFSYKLPLIFSFFSQLNYLIFLLFGEYFGSFFKNSYLYFSNFFVLLQSLKKLNVDWKWSWFFKLFVFLTIDVWKMIYKIMFSTFFFLKNIVFGGDFLSWFVAYTLQILIFVVQHVHLNNFSYIKGLLLLPKYKDFFLYKFNIYRSKDSYVLGIFLGKIGLFIEKLIFFISFFLFLIYDTYIIIFYKILKKKMYIKCFFFIKYFIIYICYFFIITNLLSPCVEFFVFCKYLDACSKKIQTKDQIKNIDSINDFFKYKYFSDIEKWVLNLLIWRFYIKKYWWDVSIKNQRGLKKIPFFFKLFKKFPWLDKVFCSCKKIYPMFDWVALKLKFFFSKKKSTLYFISFDPFLFVYFMFFTGFYFMVLIVNRCFVFLTPYIINTNINEFCFSKSKTKQGLGVLDIELWKKFLGKKEFFFFKTKKRIGLHNKDKSYLYINVNANAIRIDEKKSLSSSFNNKGSAQRLLYKLYFPEKTHTMSEAKDISLYSLNNIFIKMVADGRSTVTQKKNRIVVKPVFGFFRYSFLKKSSSRLNQYKKKVFQKKLDMVFFGKFCLFFLDKTKALNQCDFIDVSDNQQKKKTVSNIIGELKKYKEGFRKLEKSMTFSSAFFSKKNKKGEGIVIQNTQKDPFISKFENSWNGFINILLLYNNINDFLSYKHEIEKKNIKIPQSLWKYKIIFLYELFFIKCFFDYILNLVSICGICIIKGHNIFKNFVCLFYKKQNFWNQINKPTSTRPVFVQSLFFFKKQFLADTLLIQMIKKMGYKLICFEGLFGFLFNTFRFIYIKNCLFTSKFKNETEKNIFFYRQLLFNRFFNLSWEFFFSFPIYHETHFKNQSIVFSDQNNISINTLSTYFGLDFDIYIKRYWIYIYDNVLVDLMRAVQVVDLGLGKKKKYLKDDEKKNIYKSLYEEDHIFSEFLASENKSRKQKDKQGVTYLKDISKFLISKELPRKVKNLFTHNLKWLESLLDNKSTVDFQKSSAQIDLKKHEQMISKTPDASFENHSKIFFDFSLDFFFFLYNWFTFKWKFFFFLAHFKRLIFTNKVFSFVFLFLTCISVVFGVYYVFSWAFFVVMSSWVYSIGYFLFLICKMACFYLLSIFDLMTGDIFRELYESFFYFFILKMVSYDILVKLDLYTLFLFFINNIGLYEDAGFNLIRFCWMLLTSIMICSSHICFEYSTYVIFYCALLFDNFNVNGIGIYSFLFEVCWFFFYKFILIFLWQNILLVSYGYDFILLVYLYISSSLDNVVITWITDFFSLFECYSHQLRPSFAVNDIFILNSSLPFIKLDLGSYFFYIKIFYLKLTDYSILFNVIFDVVLGWIKWFLSAITTFIITCFWTFLYICLSIIDGCITFLDWSIDFFYIIKNLFFKDILILEVLQYIIQIMLWCYLNALYYVILLPFLYICTSIVVLIKYIILFPWFLVNFIKIIGLFLFDLIYTIFFFFISVVSDTILWFSVYPIQVIFYPIAPFISFIYTNYQVYIDVYTIISFFVFYIVDTIKVVFFIILAPVFSVVVLCWDGASLFLFPLFFFIKIVLNYILFFFKYFSYFYLMGKEIVLLFLTLIWGFLKIFFILWNGLFYMWDFFITFFNGVFPNFKYILDPIGGFSIFYATLYYYFFIWTCILWSYSFRVFNDTFKDPIIPEEAWIQNVEFFESHPVYQRLPLDVYNLLFSERLCSDEVNIPLELKQSLETWVPFEEVVEFPQLKIKETPLNMQGYYYMVLNDMVRKHVVQYYKNKYLITWFMKQGILEVIRKMVWNDVGFAKTKNAFWETYADFYEKKITEEDVKEMIDPSFELMKEKSKLEELNTLGQFVTHLELWFRDDTRKDRAIKMQMEIQEFYEQYGYASANELPREYPIMGKWFGHQRFNDFKRDYKTAVFKVSVKRGVDKKKLSEVQEAKRQFLINWSYYNTIQKRKEYHEGSYNYLTVHSQEKPLDIWKQQRKTLSFDDNFEFDPESFVIKKYKKKPSREDDEMSLDFSLDPFFIGLRFLDMLLYPLLVFATVNTGWWYSMNGMMDSITRYMTLEGYAEKLADVFLQHVENHNKIQSGIEKVDFSVAALQLYDSQKFINAYLPEDLQIFDDFLSQYPELYHNEFLSENPLLFINSFTDYLNNDERGLDWVYDLYEKNKISEDVFNYLTLHEETLELKNSILNENKDINQSTVDTPFLEFLNQTYDVDFLDKIRSVVDKEAEEERQGLFQAQLFNRWEGLPDFEIKSTKNIFLVDFIQDIARSVLSGQNQILDDIDVHMDLDLDGLEMKEIDDISVLSELVDIRSEEEKHSIEIEQEKLTDKKKQESAMQITFSDLTKNLHPIESEERQKLLRLRYHLFTQMNLDADFWVDKQHINVSDLIKKNFAILDGLQKGLKSIIYFDGFTLPYQSILNEDNINRDLFFFSKSISNINRDISFPILRQNNFPWTDDLWIETKDLEMSLNTLDDIRNSIYNWQSFWLNYVKTHELVELSTIADEMEEEILYGDMIYQYYTSGFLSFIHKTSFQRLLWLWFKVYEDTFFGEILHLFFRYGLLRRYSTGIEIAPYVLKEKDSMAGLIGISPFFTISDVKYLKSDFFNMYTNFSAYSHFGPLMLQRMALVYFHRPDLFDDRWFNDMISKNFYIASDVLLDHVKNAAYFYPLMFSSQAAEDRFIILKWMLTERGKQIKLFLYMLNKQILKALYDVGQYGLSFKAVYAVYSVIADPLIGLYNLSLETLHALQRLYYKIIYIFDYFITDLSVLKRLNGFVIYITKPFRDWSWFCLSFLYENCKNFFFFFTEDSLNKLGLYNWWQYSIIRGGLVFWYDLVSFLYSGYNHFKVSYDFFFFLKSWQRDFINILWNDYFAAFWFVWFESYWINFNDRLGLALMLVSSNASLWTSFLYSWNTLLAFNTFWLTAPFFVPFFWFNFLLHIVDFFKSHENYWLWFLLAQQDTFRLEWPVSVLESVDSTLLFESIIEIASIGLGKDHPINFRNSMGLEEFNQRVGDFFFLQKKNLQPILGRESTEAPFSFLSTNGLLVYSLSEVMFLSDIFMSKDFNKNLYYSVDFFKYYNNKLNSNELLVWLDFAPMAYNNSSLTTQKEYLVPKFTFFTEIGPDFYLNLRNYEKTFSLTYHRYFFHRYQELITHVLSTGSLLEKRLAETVLERKYLYSGVSHVVVSYDPIEISEIHLTLDEESKRAVVTLDIYGNIVYYNALKTKTKFL